MSVRVRVECKGVLFKFYCLRLKNLLKIICELSKMHEYQAPKFNSSKVIGA